MEIEDLDKIYIIHYVKLIERRKYLEKRLKDFGLEKYANWVMSEKDGSFDKKDLKLYNSSEKAINLRKKVFGKDKIPPIGKIDIIMMLQHIKIIKMIAKRKEEKYSLIFEDDVLLDDNFIEKLKNSIQELKKINWHICYSDKGSLLIEPKIKKTSNSGITLYKPEEFSSNTTGSYFLTPKKAKKLLNLMKDISMGPDMELTYVQRKNKLKVYWTIPFLTHQGSIEEVYKSNIRNGSLLGLCIRFLEKIGKISPKFRDILARILASFMKIMYESKTLIIIKDKIKKFIGY